MNKLKARFMFLVCQFLIDWYDSQAISNSHRERRLSKLSHFMEDLKIDQEEE